MLSKEENIMRYEILGETLPVVICYLESGEKMVTEGGGMSWMSPNMKRCSRMFIQHKAEKE